MEKAKEFLEKPAASEEAAHVSRLTFPPHQAHTESSFYEYFILRGVRIDRVQPGSIYCTFKVPPRLTDRNGNLATGAIASLVDELGAAVIHQGGQQMDVSVDMSISYISTAKMNVLLNLPAAGATAGIRDELEIVSRHLGRRGGYAGTSVLIRNKTTGEVVAEGRHSLFSKM